MAAKCKCPEGVPEWVVTYGDMMSLLLCFFILLAAFSEIKDDDFEPVLQAIKDYLGVTGGAGTAPTEDSPLQSVVARLEQVALHKEKIRTHSNADDPGVDGREVTVKRIREGLQFTVGGLISFEPGSAEIKPQAKEALVRVANVIRGHNNKVDIRGHTAGADARASGKFDSSWALSFARAQAVMDELTNATNRIDQRRLRLVGCGDTEPLVSRVYDPAQLAINRRVEVIVTEALMQEFDATAAAGP